ncbi:MAG TPA: hypothetical protein VJH95_02930 [Candidatus Nanoarchaeia archaeon]|nr:hypothetical protein [Candidatus Nanoarchaeia archaeon]
MEKKINIEKLEPAEFKFDKNAFKSEHLTCDDCNAEMKKTEIEMGMPDKSLVARLSAFQCPKCKKEYLNFEEAKKLDKALMLSRLMSNEGFKITKSLSFDGDNYIFRIPVEITRNLGKKPYAEMVPLSSRELLIHLGKQDEM